MKRKLYAYVSLVLCFTLLFGSFSLWKAAPAEAKSTRIAIVDEVGGTVNVKSAGGSKSYEAYVDMALNEGDYITTEEDSYLVVKIKDTEDELTIGANSEIYVSDLAVKGSGKKSKIKMWAGSLWSSVKKLAGVDEFEVETPTAVMGVRGTNVLTTVNPVTGQSSYTALSGFLRVISNQRDAKGLNGQTLVLPSQQISLDSGEELDDLGTKLGIVDTNEIVKQASAKIIEAILKNKADIDRENDEFIQKKKKELEQGTSGSDDGSLIIKDQNELDKVNKNLNNLIGNVIKSAIQNGKVDKEELQKRIDAANSKTNDPAKKLDLNKVEELDKTAGTDPEREKAKKTALERLELEKKKRAEAAKASADKIKKQLELILLQIELDKKRLSEANANSLKQQQEKAKQELLNKMTPEERKRFEEAERKNQPTPTPAPTDSSGTGTTVQPPSAPANVVAVALPDGKVKLSWGSVSGATSYSVLRSTKQDGEYVSAANGLSNTSYTDSDTVTGTSYYYKIIARNNGGNSQASPIAYALSQIAKPGKPSIKGISAGDGKVGLSWESVSNADSYTVKRSLSEVGPFTDVKTGLKETVYEDTGLTNGTNYYYQVYAVNAGGESEPSSPVHALPQAKPSIPTGVTAAPGDSIITLTWSGVEGATSYTVKRSLEANGPFETVESGLTTNTFIDTALTNGQKYYYLVIAVNAVGESEASLVAYGTPQIEKPGKPFIPLVSSGNGQVSLSWLAVTGATSYTVKRGLSRTGSFTETASGLTGLTYVDQNLTNGTEYFYQIIAVNAGGESVPSDIVSTVPNVPMPSPVDQLTATVEASKVKLSWKANGAWTEGYKVMRSTTANEGYVLVNTLASTENSYADVNVMIGTTYYYKIVSYNSAGIVESETVHAIPLPPAPTDLGATTGDGQVPLFWTAVTGASGYKIKRSDSMFSGYTVIQDNWSGTSYVDFNVTNDETYYYKVSAIVNGVESADTYVVFVKPEAPTIPVTGVSFSPDLSDLEMQQGRTHQMVSEINPPNATNKEVSWSSNNEAVATVDNEGLVTAISPGTATITVKTDDGGFTKSIQVTVQQPVPSNHITFELTPNAGTYADGETLTLSVFGENIPNLYGLEVNLSGLLHYSTDGNPYLRMLSLSPNGIVDSQLFSHENSISTLHPVPSAIHGSDSPGKRRFDYVYAALFDGTHVNEDQAVGSKKLLFRIPLKVEAIKGSGVTDQTIDGTLTVKVLITDKTGEKSVYAAPYTKIITATPRGSLD
ncbi:fibronectin type III domain-containing protein [Paenibacillus sp. MBLB4367]|uniref:fibronectin type III domain-containing protein n=1 Tax=Paenibacillus sp. MBLB4367 TaxID=3384767 RepID=UPI0039083961